MNILDDIKHEKKLIEKRESDESMRRNSMINDWLDDAKEASKGISAKIRACFVEHAKSINTDKQLMVKPCITTTTRGNQKCAFSAMDTVLVYFHANEEVNRAMEKERAYYSCLTKLAAFIKEDLAANGQETEPISQDSNNHICIVLH